MSGVKSTRSGAQSDQTLSSGSLSEYDVEIDNLLDDSNTGHYLLEDLRDSEVKQPPLFSLHTASHKQTRKMVSLFIADLPREDSSDAVRESQISLRSFSQDRTTRLVNAIHRLRTIRHPGIIRYKSAFEEGGKVVVVTEPVTPLHRVIRMLPVEEVGLGLFSLLVSLLKTVSSILCSNDPIFKISSIRKQSSSCMDKDFLTMQFLQSRVL